MNIVKSTRDYITKMVTDAPGMKVLLLDADTTTIVSMVYAQSEMLSKEVYLIERVEQKSREAMAHLRCVVFVRPTADSLDALADELRKPKYGSYDLYFSNVLKPDQLERLAEADEHEVVREVHEFFADVLAVNPHLFTLNLPAVVCDNAWRRPALERSVQGIAAALLSLKKRPLVRYAASSAPCQALAAELARLMAAEGQLFDSRQGREGPPLLLLLDRRDDPVTPLLHQWTYQAMVHDLLGIANNRVDLGNAPKAPKDREQREFVLNSEQDAFYAANLYANYGEIGASIKALVAEYKDKAKSNEKLDTVEDMKRFVENYPEFKAASGNTAKHLAVVGELSRLINEGQIFEVSEAEQEIACQSSHAEAVAKLQPLLANPAVRGRDKLRLVLLYALRYERNSASILPELSDALARAPAGPTGAGALTETERRLVPQLLRYAGAAAPGRSSDLFGTKGAAGIFKRLAGGLRGVENIYTQHTPLLLQTLEAVLKGKLKDAAYPYAAGEGAAVASASGPASTAAGGGAAAACPADVFVFMVGGCTYEEAAAVAAFNTANSGTMRVVLGGTTIHNSDTFLEEVLKSSKTADLPPATAAAASSRVA